MAQKCRFAQAWIVAAKDKLDFRVGRWETAVDDMLRENKTAEEIHDTCACPTCRHVDTYWCHVSTVSKPFRTRFEYLSEYLSELFSTRFSRSEHLNE